MSHKFYHSSLVLLGVFVVLFLLRSFVSHAQVSGEADANVSKMLGYQSECAIAKNPTNKLQLFAFCNNQNGPGLFAARSTNGGQSWIYPDPADKTIADGDAQQGAAGWGDPSLAWDTFGNLFITYLDQAKSNIVTLISTDGGATFDDLASFGPATVDQPTVVADAGAVWIVWAQGFNTTQMVARGATVTGLGKNKVGAFKQPQTIPGTTNCTFGDIAISPGGVVVNVCQTTNFMNGEGQETILVNIDADGLGNGDFGPAIAVTTTNVGGYDLIPAQDFRTIGAEAGLAFDRNNDPMNPSPHFGRLYLVYTDEVVDESNDTDIMLRWSDDNGATWPGGPIRVNDDPAVPIRSQFFPKIASNPLSGNIGVCWYDARNSATNTAVQVFCTIATPTGASPIFMANAQISGGSSVTGANLNQFGDYTGLAYFQGLMHPIWGDSSNNGGLNPNGTTDFDAYSDRVTGGAAANEGDPHITTVDGIHYDFQSAGEFVSLRDADGLQIQTRQTAISTESALGPNSHTGLTTCVSINTAVAARVGKHRVTFQPNLDGRPDPNGLQLRVDGVLSVVGSNGIDLGAGGRITKTAGESIRIDFPNGTLLVVSPHYWQSQGKWWLNVDVLNSPAVEGIMGALAPGSWLPGLPDGTSLGPKPASLHQRYLDLYEKFADAWRVTDKTSLFDYAPGTSTASFTIDSWPMENPPCTVPQSPLAQSLDLKTAQRLCSGVVGKNRKADCIFDVRVTGEPGFAKLYLLSEQIQAGLTTTIVSADKDPTGPGELVTFTALVGQSVSLRRRVPAGSIEFILDGERVGLPIKLDSRGQARWRTRNLKAGNHKVLGRYIPASGTSFLASIGEKLHSVNERE